MRGFSLIQPWATLLARGAKRVESRAWPTTYRGLIAIHASKAFPRDAIECCQIEPFSSALKRAGVQCAADLPRGAIIAVGTLKSILRVGPEDRWPPPGSIIDGLLNQTEREFGDYTAGRYAWVFGVVKPLPAPIPYRGARDLWRLDSGLETELTRFYAEAPR